MKEYFEDLFKRRKLDLYDFNSYEFCDQDKLCQEERTVDSIFVDQLTVLYLSLTKSIHLKLFIMNEDTKRAGVDIIVEHFIPELERLRIFVMGSIKSMSEGTNLDSECLDVFGISEKDNEDYLARQGVREKDPVLSKEKERLRTNSFLRGENSSLSILSKSHVDHDKKPKSVRL